MASLCFSDPKLQKTPQAANCNGKVTATTDLTNVYGATISRAGVACFMIEQVIDDRWLSKTPLITSSR
ncbi:hypothetical protein HDE79_003972 [Rhodanobacter sp. MP1X3]|nr:hypothetical protein [Rhodanobacter sp. MP1X3]